MPFPPQHGKKYCMISICQRSQATTRLDFQILYALQLRSTLTLVNTPVSRNRLSRCLPNVSLTMNCCLLQSTDEDSQAKPVMLPRTPTLTSQHLHQPQPSAFARAPLQPYRRQLQQHTQSTHSSRSHTTTSPSMLSISIPSCQHFNRAAVEKYGPKRRCPNARRRQEMCVQRRSRSR